MRSIRWDFAFGKGLVRVVLVKASGCWNVV